MKTKMIGTLAIASLIAMAVFVGPAAAEGNAYISASRTFLVSEWRQNFVTTDNVYGWGYLGPESDPSDMGGRVYVVTHKETWTDGDTLADVSSDGYETVSWGTYGNFFILAWPTTLDPGTYDLILDLDVTGRNGVWTNISQDELPGVYMSRGYIDDPIWTFTVPDDEPEPIPEFSTMAIPVAAILGLLFLFNYRKRRREG